MKEYPVAIVVSKDYANLTLIKNTIFEAKQKLGDALEICQITDNYMHDDIKKFVKEQGIYHTDILRFDEHFNLDAHDSNEYKFNQPFNPKWFHVRNDSVIKYCRGIFGFVSRSVEKTDAVYLIIQKAKKEEMKNLKIFS